MSKYDFKALLLSSITAACIYHVSMYSVYFETLAGNDIIYFYSDRPMSRETFEIVTSDDSDKVKMMGATSSSSSSCEIEYGYEHEEGGGGLLMPMNDIGKSILITGGAGFIGFHTATELRNLGHDVIVIDNMNDYYSIELKHERIEMLQNAGVTFIEGDVCNETLLLSSIKEHRIDRVVHLAAQAGVGFSLKSPHSYTKNNVDCFVSVLETYVKSGLTKMPIVYASSSSVYGFNNDSPFVEGKSEVDRPASLYAATKRADELIAHTYNHLYSVSSVGLRFFTVYGPWGRPDMSPMIFYNKIQNNEKLTLTNFGNSIRDYTYVEDIVNGILASLRLTTEKSEIFNLGCNNPIKVTYFVDLMERNMKKKANIHFVKLQPGDVPTTYADVNKAACLLQWKPHTKIEDGITKFTKWAMAHNATKYMRNQKSSTLTLNSTVTVN